MQALMAQAQKMQRELKKAHEELAKKEFVVSKNNAVEVVVLGNKIVKSVHIEESAFDKEYKDMVEEMIVMAIDEAYKNIDDEIGNINERITGRREGLGM